MNKHFQVIQGDDPEEVGNVIDKLMDEGWLLKGGFIYNSDEGYYAQAMIKDHSFRPRRANGFNKDKEEEFAF